ncbi:MAG: ribonuclease H-like domain-containing protein [Patescibacteria group bacterium]
MDTLVFDIETQNFFTDPDVGWNNYDALKISVVGVYSYEKDQYLAFDEFEMEALASLFRNASQLVGFSMNRYDIPVLHRYFQALQDVNGLDLWGKERVDLLSEIEMATGDRISLDKLALANLGVGKTGHGSEAITMYKNGEMEKLKSYCLMDVELTRKLYDLYRENKSLLVPDKKTGAVVTVNFSKGQDVQKPALF